MVAKAADLLHGRDVEVMRYEADRYENCRKRKGLYRCEHGCAEFSFHRFCHSRICEVCGRIFKQRLSAQLIPVIKGLLENKRRGYTLASLTLTVNKARFNGKMPDRRGIARLHKESAKMLKMFYGKFIVKERANGKLHEPAPRWIYGKVPVTGRRKKLHARKPIMVKTRKGAFREDYRYWKGAGAIACLEVGKDNNNLHLHAIVYGPIADWFKFKSAWEKITGDSSNFKLQEIGPNKQVKTIEAAVGHLLKYITKPPVSESYSQVAEYAIMLRGSRRLKTSGIFYNRIKLVKRLTEEKSCLFCNGRLRFVKEADLATAADAIDYYAASKDNSLLIGRCTFKDWQFVDLKYKHLLPN